jgi:molybdopterin biosynthesis enzyme
MIRVEEALNKILDEVSPLGMEKVNLLDALG